MSNPFRQKIPIGTDLRIRARLLRAWVADHLTISFGVFLIPAFALWLLVFNVSSTTPIDTDVLIAEIKSAQAIELAAAESNIYHVTREISEGREKAAYVLEVLEDSVEAQPRVDRVETYQHSDTALAMIESNGTERSFEAFLSREHDDGNISLHHYGPKTGDVASERAAYDKAHNLASLYTEYTSLERPAIPVLAESATFVSIDEETNQAQFRTKLSEAITIHSYVDLDSKQVIEDIIYVAGSGNVEYEMTRVSYIEREIIPAEQFESVFDPTQYEYEVIAMREKETV